MYIIQNISDEFNLFIEFMEVMTGGDDWSSSKCNIYYSF